MSKTRLISTKRLSLVILAISAAMVSTLLFGCTDTADKRGEAGKAVQAEPQQIEVEPVRDCPKPTNDEDEVGADTRERPVRTDAEADASEASDAESTAVPVIAITEDFRESFDHGPKGAEYQKYIVLHDTEGKSDAASVIDWWDSNGNLVAAHFIVNKDGSIWQCVPLDRIAHHAGYGDTGHNEQYSISEDGRDDMKGSSPIGGAFADYGMNGSSIGIEMVHVSGEDDYPEAQLDALDALIAYIDDYYGFESEIIDHKAWRSGNSDTSPEFADFLQSYQTKRKHA